jgi:hypothetical protein
MPNPSDAIDNALAEIEAAAASVKGSRSGGSPRGPRPVRKGSGSRSWRLIRWTALAIVALLLPFWVLILGSTIAAETLDIGPWMSLLVAAVATSSLIAIYFWVATRRLGQRPGRWIPRLSVAVVLAYCVYGLVFISPKHLKDPEIAETYTSLHPVIRLSLSTLVLVDAGHRRGSGS